MVYGVILHLWQLSCAAHNHLPCVALLGTQFMKYGPTYHTVIWFSLITPRLSQALDKDVRYDDSNNEARQIQLSHCIICFRGELLLWDLCKPGRQKWEVITPGEATRGHSRILFNICAGGPDLNTICTISMDREVGNVII